MSQVWVLIGIVLCVLALRLIFEKVGSRKAMTLAERIAILSSTAAGIVKINLQLASETYDALVLDPKALGMAYGILDACLQRAHIDKDAERGIALRLFFRAIAEDEHKGDLIGTWFVTIEDNPHVQEGAILAGRDCDAWLARGRQGNNPLELFAYLKDESSKPSAFPRTAEEGAAFLASLNNEPA